MMAFNLLHVLMLAKVLLSAWMSNFVTEDDLSPISEKALFAHPLDVRQSHAVWLWASWLFWGLPSLPFSGWIIKAAMH